ncbi:MAG: ATP-grasp domain-containing protein [Bacteroidota bacterium]
MKIGITYDLMQDYLDMGFSREEAAEFDKPETIQAIHGGLLALGHEVVQIGNITKLTERLVAGDRWHIVFNICEGVYGIGREAQVPAILDAYRIPYVFSDPLVLALTLHKGMTKRVIRDLGIPTPDFDLVECADEIADVHLSYPVFVKPACEGSGKGIDASSKVVDAEGLHKTCTQLLKKFGGPLLVEEFLPGREFTIAIIGTGEDAKCLGIMECIFRKNAPTDSYSYENKNNYEEFMDYDFPEGPVADRCMAVALEAWRGLGCRDAGRIDIRMDKHGTPNFIEVNPLAGLHPIDSDLPIIGRHRGIDFNTVIKMIMESALKRNP